MATIKEDGHEILECDNCGAYGYEDEPLYIYEGKELCRDCLLEAIGGHSWDDIEEEYGIKAECQECHTDKEDTYYYYDGQWWCEDCLLQRFEKAEIEEPDFDDDDYGVDWD